MIDPKKPLETGPDERNPVPVRCEYIMTKWDGVFEIKICGDWFDEDGINLGNDWWIFGPSGKSEANWLPTIRNVQDPSTAKAPDAGCVEQGVNFAVIAGLLMGAMEQIASCQSHAPGDVVDIARAALARAKEMMK